MEIAAVINYCTNDDRFLGRAIKEVSVFAKQIIVPVSDHYFDGTKENRKRLEQTYAQFPNVQFLEFAYSHEKLYTPYIQRRSSDEDWGCLWHSTARYLAFLYLSKEIDYVLFLDADEIIEGDRFKTWLKQMPKDNAFWFSSYCYGFEASKRAPHTQQTALLVKKEALSPLKILNSSERFGIFASVESPKSFDIKGLDGKPMIHHYSWVRREDELLKKVSTWGKKHQCNWSTWMEKAKIEMNQYETVTPYFDALAPLKNVIKITPKIAFEKEIYELL